jgi:hypothetical protein
MDQDRTGNGNDVMDGRNPTLRGETAKVGAPEVWLQSQNEEESYPGAGIVEACGISLDCSCKLRLSNVYRLFGITSIYVRRSSNEPSYLIDREL